MKHQTLKALLAATLLAAAAPAIGQNKSSAIPYVASRHDAVRDMLWLAGVGKEDVLYDLGSGDGRIVIAAVREFGAGRAIGIEKDPELVRQSRENARKAGVSDRVQFIQGDLFTNDIRQASVVTLYLGHSPNIKLRSKILRTLTPGTRVVSHQFGMGEWKTDKSLTVRTTGQGMYGEMWNPFSENPLLPEYTGNEGHYLTHQKILMWIVPAAVAGHWQGEIETRNGRRKVTIALHQRLSTVTGTFEVAGQTNLTGPIDAELWGDHLRFEANAHQLGYGGFQLRFDGHVRGTNLHGALAVVEKRKSRESEWAATRAPADFSGNWEWPSLTGSRKVQLKITRDDGSYTAHYVDGTESIPVTDFYDHGGGVYFTLLLGRTPSGALRINTETGWLLGEGLFNDGSLKGKIEFHPYKEPLDKKAKTVVRGWAPVSKQGALKRN